MTRPSPNPAGRPVSTGRGDKLGTRLTLRLSAEERYLLDVASERAGEYVTAAWARAVLLRAAKRQR